LVTNTGTGAVTYTPGSLEIYASGNIDIGGQGSANTVTTQNYNPPAANVVSVVTTTTIANVTDQYGKGQQKDTVIGWNYKQTVTTVTTYTDGTSKTVGPNSTNYLALIESGATKPVAGTTSSSSGGTYVDTGTQAGQPQNFRIYGTRTDEEVKTYGNQSIKISGNGSLSGVIYAPNGDISAKGGGNSGFIHGSLVGASLTFTGNDCFYYDESLADLGGDAGFKFESWEEFSVTSVDGTEKAKLAF
jgi:hypothetical protein